jgi:AAA15 family ATPase/GTPase
MLVEFSVGNFWSFKEIQTLQMRAAKISSKYPKLDEDNVVVVDEQLSVLKSKAVFGANGSGKSNLVRAMVAMLSIIDESLKDMKVLEKNIAPFAFSRELLTEPSFFQISFIHNDILFRYGFEANSIKITSEWLLGKPINRQSSVRERTFFTRSEMKVDVSESNLKEAKHFAKHDSKEIPLFRENVLFLSVLATWNVQIALGIFNYFNEGLHFVKDAKTGISFNPVFSRAKLIPNYWEKLNILLKAIDPSIKEVRKISNYNNYEDVNNQSVYTGMAAEPRFRELSMGGDIEIIRLTENKDLTAFRLSTQEAEGTKKLFILSPHIFSALDYGGVLIIDEFDAKMHPQLTRKIVELFHSPSTNLNNAQLVFITHDSNLLDPQLLRRDQISFAQKDKNGATDLYSLVEFKGVRNDASFEKDYLQGKYYAVPTNLNQLEALFESH